MQELQKNPEVEYDQILERKIFDFPKLARAYFNMYFIRCVPEVYSEYVPFQRRSDSRVEVPR